ncbi:MAG: hypothetical protein K8U03_09345 [Planctomycetia bacterium]|nr:hypothetical protein [Planctomycetia bacterium]
MAGRKRTPKSIEATVLRLTKAKRLLTHEIAREAGISRWTVRRIRNRNPAPQQSTAGAP